MTETTLEAAQADLEVAQPAVIVRIELAAVTVIGDEGALGEGVEGRGGHDQRESVGVDGLGERRVLPVPTTGLVIADALLDSHAAAIIGQGGATVGPITGDVNRRLYLALRHIS